MNQFLEKLTTINFAYQNKLISHIEDNIGWANEVSVNAYLLKELSVYTTTPIETICTIVRQLLEQTSLRYTSTETNALEVLLFESSIVDIVDEL